MTESLGTIAPMPPLPRDPAIQAALDAEHLRLLKIVYYIAGAVTAAFSCIFIIHFVMFLGVGLNPQIFANQTSSTGKHADAPPPALFLGFAFVIGFVILLGWIFGALQIFAGRCLGRREHLPFVTVIAALECLFIPWGTALGVFTFMVLNRDSVRVLFHKPSP